MRVTSSTPTSHPCRRFHVKRASGKAVVGLLALLACVAAAPSRAEAQEPPKTRPQWNGGLNLGAVGEGNRDDGLWHDGKFALGARGDVLFGRGSMYDWGIGPMAQLGTQGFDSFQAGGGLSVHVPIHPYLPLVPSVGALASNAAADSFQPTGFVSLFWGSRSFNYHSDYVLSAGLLLEYRHGFGDSREQTILIQTHLDLQVLALPVLFAINALR